MAAHDVFNSFKTPCVETIPREFSRSDRQANMSGRTMDAENHRLLLTSSTAYNSFFKTTENTLQIQRKYQVLVVYHVPESRIRSPESRIPSPESHVPESQSPRPRPTFSHSQNITLKSTMIKQWNSLLPQ